MLRGPLSRGDPGRSSVESTRRPLGSSPRPLCATLSRRARIRTRCQVSLRVRCPWTVEESCLLGPAGPAEGERHDVQQDCRRPRGRGAGGRGARARRSVDEPRYPAAASVRDPQAGRLRELPRRLRRLQQPRALEHVGGIAHGPGVARSFVLGGARRREQRPSGIRRLLPPLPRPDRLARGPVGTARAEVRRRVRLRREARRTGTRTLDGISCHVCHRMDDQLEPAGPVRTPSTPRTAASGSTTPTATAMGEPCRRGPYDYPADGIAAATRTRGPTPRTPRTPPSAGTATT